MKQFSEEQPGSGYCNPRCIVDANNIHCRIWGQDDKDGSFIIISHCNTCGGSWYSGAIPKDAFPYEKVEETLSRVMKWVRIPVLTTEERLEDIEDRLKQIEKNKSHE